MSRLVSDGIHFTTRYNGKRIQRIGYKEDSVEQLYLRRILGRTDKEVR